MFKFIKSLFVPDPEPEPDFDLEVGKLYQTTSGGVIARIAKLEESNKIVHYTFYPLSTINVVSHICFKRLYKPL